MTKYVEGDQDNRPGVYWEDVDGELFLIIRASSIGNPCLFELAAAGQGHDQVQLPGFMRRAFGEGHAREAEAIEKLRMEYGYVHTTAQSEGHLIIPPNIMVRFHPDGEGHFVEPPYDALGPCGIEVKWLRHESWLKATGPGGSVADIVKEYKWQISLMMHATRKPFVWVAGNKGFPPDKETGVKPYCEDEGKLGIEVVEWPPVSLAEIREKAEKIRELVLGEDVLTGDLECTDVTHFPCRYLHLRPEPELLDTGDAGGENDMAEVLQLDSDSEEGQELDQLVRDYVYHHGHAKEAKARADALKAEILARAGSGVQRIQTDKFVVPIQTNTTTKIHWDEMSPELKRAVEKYVEKKKTAPFIRDVKGLG